MGGVCARKAIDIPVPIGTNPVQFEKMSLENLAICCDFLDRCRQKDDLEAKIPGKKRRIALAYMVEFVSFTTGLVKEVAVEDVAKEIAECLVLTQQWAAEERVAASSRKRVAPMIDKFMRRRVAALLYQHRDLLEAGELELREHLDFTLLQNQLLLPLPYSHVSALVKLFDIINYRKSGSLTLGEVQAWIKERWPFVARSIFFPMFMEMCDTDREQCLRVNEWVLSYDLYCTLEEFTLVELLFYFIARWRDSHGEKVIDSSRLKEEFPVLAEDVTTTGEDVNRPMLAVFHQHYEKRSEIFTGSEAPLITLPEFKKLHQSTQQMLYPMFFLQRGLRDLVAGTRYWSRRTEALADKILEEGESKRSMQKRQATLRELPIEASVAYIALDDADREEEVDLTRTEVLTYENWEAFKVGKAIDLKHLKGRAAEFSGGTAVVQGKMQQRAMNKNKVAEVKRTDHTVTTAAVGRTAHTPASHLLAHKLRKDPIKAYFDAQHNHKAAGTMAPVAADDWIVATRGRQRKQKAKAAQAKRGNIVGGAGGGVGSAPKERERRRSTTGKERRRSSTTGGGAVASRRRSVT
mmetsp:Transcript_5627/g.20149  ORF Transcript_5627/g.20149 Transcript_5627/m.20149 type:complete len:578 (-) Transcript_5627:142-1875(-)